MLQSRMGRYVILVVLLASSALVVFLVSRGQQTIGTDVAKRTQPFRIGALTESWGPTPHVTGLRDGLLALGYREHEEFAIGVRFTQGDLAALPAAAREIDQQGGIRGRWFGEALAVFPSELILDKAREIAGKH